MVGHVGDMESGSPHFTMNETLVSCPCHVKAIKLEEQNKALTETLEAVDAELYGCIHPDCPIIDGYGAWCCAKGVIKGALVAN